MTDITMITIDFFNGTEFENKRMIGIIEDELELFIRKVITDHNLTRKAFSNFRTLVLWIFKYAKKANRY